MQSMDTFTNSNNTTNETQQTVVSQPASAFPYRCIKCSSNEFDTDTFQATGGGFAKALDVQNKKFKIIYCKKCGYAELYKANASIFGNIMDGLF